MGGIHDPARRRVMVRRGREKGCWLYVPAEVLKKAGHDPDDAPPYYRTWAGRKHTVLVQTYSEP